MKKYLILYRVWSGIYCAYFEIPSSKRPNSRGCRHYHLPHSLTSYGLQSPAFTFEGVAGLCVMDCGVHKGKHKCQILTYLLTFLRTSFRPALYEKLI
jgi:hypothetical protein